MVLLELLTQVKSLGNFHILAYRILCFPNFYVDFTRGNPSYVSRTLSNKTSHLNFKPRNVYLQKFLGIGFS